MNEGTIGKGVSKFKRNHKGLWNIQEPATTLPLPDPRGQEEGAIMRMEPGLSERIALQELGFQWRNTTIEKLWPARERQPREYMPSQSLCSSISHQCLPLAGPSWKPEIKGAH